jgi:hypothetical protein
MSMDNPEAGPPPSMAPVVIRIILGIIFLLPGACGTVFFGASFFEWLSKGFAFSGPDRGYASIFIILPVISILVSIVLIGILLRFARWKSAPSASLALAIISGITIVVGHQMMVSTFNEGDTESRIGMIVVSLLYLAVATLPPFLHWWKARQN